MLNQFGSRWVCEMRNLNLLIKRLIDLLGSLMGLIVISPVFIIIAILIKFTSKGPIFFKQDRLGKNGKVFKIFKFRTMVVNAEKIGDGLFVYGDKDSRITKIGKKLRKTSLDEIPQLLNVLLGDMSLVGPRPPVTYFPYKIEEYSDRQKLRFSMLPGITGLAQIKTRTNAPWDERIEIDINYVEKFNVLLDIKILFKTISKIMTKENIYPEYVKVEDSKSRGV